MRYASKAKHHPAAFINVIAEDGSKEEAVEQLQETWNELCEARNQIKKQTTDYHDFSWPSCSVEHRRKLDIGELYINAAICKLCGWFIRSRNRHDYVSCRCGATSVDGGSWYAARTGNPENYENIIVMFDNLEPSTERLN